MGGLIVRLFLVGGLILGGGKFLFGCGLVGLGVGGGLFLIGMFNLFNWVLIVVCFLKREFLFVMYVL